MESRVRRTTLAGSFVLMVLAMPARAEDPPSNQQLYDLYQEQQEQIDATADRVDEHGGESWASRTDLGGYAELHFNFLAGSGGGAKNKSEADFHRFVIELEHSFNDKIRFFSEIEIEHSLAGDGKPGEVELEQAFVQFDLPHETTANAGLFLMPVGIINPTHEPPTFYGVERNLIETEIIPTTWWEGGVLLSHRWDRGLTTDLAVHTALQTRYEESDDPFDIRAGRQKVAEANASDVAITGRAVYRGYPGLELAASVMWTEDIAAGGENTPATLFEAHVVYEKGRFGLRALYARWDLFSDAAEDLGKDEQYGFYVEPSYKMIDWLGVFGRYNQYNTSAGNAGGTMRQYDVGFNFWPHEQVVLKVDGQFQRNDGGAPELDGVNLGIGLSF